MAGILRRMHRVGFLGAYLPEFEPLTDLVQHEFFHRYTADEHTLRCIDILDSLIHTEDPKEQFFRETFRNLEDPVALYVALLMHDTGRAETSDITKTPAPCWRVRFAVGSTIEGDRLRLIIFLVDHHLSFWSTATTKDISDPVTIADFATTVKDVVSMESLYLFTYVDSKGHQRRSLE